MSQRSLAFNASLRVQDDQGRYLPATAEQILEEARRVIDLKTQRGEAFTSPERVKEYLITKLAGSNMRFSLHCSWMPNTN